MNQKDTNRFSAWFCYQREQKASEERKQKRDERLFPEKDEKNTKLGDALKRLNEDFCASGLIPVKLDIAGKWNQIVGNRIAEHSEPVDLIDGKLVVRVTNSIWRYHLWFLRSEIISKINRQFKKVLVKEIILTG